MRRIMADLKKLDEIVDELGKQSEKLMSFTEIYTEISKLKDDIGVNVSSFESSSKKLNEISEDVKTQTQELATQLTEMKSSLQQRIELIEENNKKFQREFDTSNVSRLERFKSDIEVTIRSEGGQTAKTIESSLKTTFLDKLNQLEKRVDLLKFLYLLGIAILAANIYLINHLLN